MSLPCTYTVRLSSDKLHPVSLFPIGYFIPLLPFSDLYYILPVPILEILNPIPDTPHPITYTLYPIPFTLYPIPYTLYPLPYTQHPTPQSRNPKP